MAGVGEGEPLVLTHVEGGIAELVLNRPKALNSLNTEMVTAALAAYRTWLAPRSGVRAVLLRGAGARAFCAGGDVKQAAQQVVSGQLDAAMDFFRREYLCDAQVSQLVLPHVALLDGIVMGGGAGISMHGAFRVATERTLFAMPECGIGLFPDVGMMALLPRLPGHVGAWLALTGARLRGHEVKQAGLATHFIPSAQLPAVKAALLQAGPAACDHAAVCALLDRLEAAAAPAAAAPAAAGPAAAGPAAAGPAAAGPAAAAAAAAGPGSSAPSSLASRLPVISRCFGHRRVADVVAALQAEAAEPAWAADALQQLQRGSPLSVAVSLAYYWRAREGGWGPLECLQQDAVLCGHFMAGEGDFAEGVRARLVDRDDAPAWKHAGHEQVPQALVDSFFRPRRPADVLDLRAMLAGAGGGGAQQAQPRL